MVWFLAVRDTPLSVKPNPTLPRQSWWHWLAEFKLFDCFVGIFTFVVLRLQSWCWWCYFHSLLFQFKFALVNLLYEPALYSSFSEVFFILSKGNKTTINTNKTNTANLKKPHTHTSDFITHTPGTNLLSECARWVTHYQQIQTFCGSVRVKTDRKIENSQKF